MKIDVLEWYDFDVKKFFHNFSSKIGVKIKLRITTKNMEPIRKKGIPKNRFLSRLDSQIQSDSVGVKCCDKFYWCNECGVILSVSRFSMPLGNFQIRKTGYIVKHWVIALCPLFFLVLLINMIWVTCIVQSDNYQL